MSVSQSCSQDTIKQDSSQDLERLLQSFLFFVLFYVLPILLLVLYTRYAYHFATTLALLAISIQEECGNNEKPGQHGVTDVYTRVSSYIGWIFEFIKDRHELSAASQRTLFKLRKTRNDAKRFT